MRLFLAVPVPKPFIEQCLALQNTFKEAAEPIAWVKPEQFHITLRFIAEYPASEIEQLQAALREQLKPFAAFEMSLGSVGGFPSMIRPKVIWLDVETGKSQLGALARAAESAVQSLGVAASASGFKPHLTLGRVRRGASIVQLPLERAESQIAALRGRCWTVNAVVLYQSILGHKGAEHRSLASFDLGE